MGKGGMERDWEGGEGLRRVRTNQEYQVLQLVRGGRRWEGMGDEELGREDKDGKGT